MESGSRRLLLAVGLSVLIMMLWGQLMSRRYPPPARSAASQSASQPEFSEGASTQPARIGAAPGAAAPPESNAATSAAPAGTAPRGLKAVAAAGPELVELGSDLPTKPGDPSKYWLYLKFAALGGAIDTASVLPFRNDVPRGRTPPSDTYDLLAPWTDPDTGEAHRSFGTTLLKFTDLKQEIDLGSVAWNARTETRGESQSAIFETDVTFDGAPLVRVRKSYELRPGSFSVATRLAVENLTAQPVVLSIVQQGAIGLRMEDSRGHDHFVLSGVKRGGEFHATTADRGTVLKAEQRRHDLMPAETDVQWVAQVNKWFTCAIHPLPAADDAADAPLKWVKATATTWTPRSDVEIDLRTELVFRPEAGVPAHAACAAEMDVYLGPKDRSLFADSTAYAALGYDTIVDATSQSCAIMTFRPIQAFMRWLLHILNRGFSSVLGGSQNYGLAIIVMVILVRLMLHGLTKRGQISMMRTQKRMARVQPKMAAIKLKHASDPQAMNREMMQLYREEGISPFASLSGCIPMFIQMPIWVALWSTLNSTIELRHAPFILWMKDLASPDAIISFGGNYHIPLLGSMIGPISSLNLLPIFMTITMVAQMKLTQKLTRPDKPAEPPPPPVDGQPTPEEQMRQQQQIMMFTTIFFGFMLYNSPCGLNLYIWTSSLLGMLEQWRIRKHISEMDLAAPAATAAAGASGPREKIFPDMKRPRWLEKLEKMAEDSRKAPPKKAESARKPPGKRS